MYQLNKLPIDMTLDEFPNTNCFKVIDLFWATSGKLTELPKADCCIKNVCCDFLKEGCFLKNKKEC